jgi:hypothetical protein
MDEVYLPSKILVQPPAQSPATRLSVGLTLFLALCYDEFVGHGLLLLLGNSIY